MRKEEKAALIEELKEKFQTNQTFYVMDGGGMSVAHTNVFRRMCFEKGVDYKVYKNTLIKKALEAVDVKTDAFDAVLKGFSGIMFSGEAANLPARMIKDYRKKQGINKPALKAASIEYEVFLGEENLTALSELKSKNELIADVIALLQSPAKNVISALQSGQNTITGVLKAIEERAN